jgi:predicted dehydrogenase
MRLGIIGLSEGNGHPFSFSAIVNGYDHFAFGQSGWPGILDYLERQPPESFGFPDVKVTHAWTQDPDTTAKLCAACRIAHPAATVEDMVGHIDALIVARDDWPTHLAFARPFLDRGVPVFIDKPLSLDERELDYFAPHLHAGRLMSTAGLRYARELDPLRSDLNLLGPIRHVALTVLLNVERYGIHMLDALHGLGLPPVRRVTRLAAAHESFTLTLADGTPVALNCLGAVGKTFHVSVFGEKGHAHFDLHDNFTAFRRTLAAFVDMLSTRKPPVPPQQVVSTMQLIRAAQQLAPGESWDARNG